MNTERETPRSSFTFFPFNNEEQMIAGATVDELVELIELQPHLTTQYFHELWRTGRTNDIREIGGYIGIELIDTYYNEYEMGESARQLSTDGKVADDEIQTFIFETNLRFLGGMIYKDDQDEDFYSFVGELSVNMMKVYEALSLEYSAKFN